MQDKKTHNINGAVDKLRPIMLNFFYLLCFWAVLKKVVYYAQYYAHNYRKYATVLKQFIIFNN